ncbi:hypothetical protein ACXYMU_07330 [Pontibacter sp. CAU 1760]
MCSFYKPISFIALSAVFSLFSYNAEAQFNRNKFNSEDAFSAPRGFRGSESSGFEITGGVGFGIMNSDNRGHQFGENGLRPIANNGIGQYLSLGGLYNFNQRLSALASFDYSKFKGEEDKTKHLAHPDDVTFNSSIAQLTGSVLFNFADQYTGTGGNRHLTFVVPYVKAGIGLARHKASSYTSDQSGGRVYHAAQTDYPAVAAVFPIGAGFKFNVSDAMSIAPEITMNFSSTDHSDNRKNEVGFLGKNDHFLNASVKIFYKIKHTKKAPAFEVQ